MNDQTRSAKLAPQTKRAQGGVGAPHLQEGGPGGNPSGPRDTGDPGDRRSGDGSAGTSPSMGRERKDEGWTRRQRGPQEQDR
ncbi:MAG TPA: hypothetical protein VFR93_00165 [Candidatus Limnocylindrales bacterium]|nr:hypothetical protein [Candidatus Limnocylindrales bacterium]